MQPEILFPIDQPVMPEGRQIGRLPSIERLEQKLASPTHTWLIGERRIGKTSVAKAVLARSRAAGSVALEVDLSRPGLATALAAVSALLAGADDGAPGLDPTLGALGLHARATGRRVWLLLDEVHRLKRLEGAEETVAHWCRRPESPLVFLFAGSEQSAVRALREEARPLAAVGEEFELAEIAFEDWLVGLRARFAEAGVMIADAEIYAVLESSGGHPRRTMMIASRVNDSAASQPDRRADATLVELAITDARRDRSWQ